MHTIVFSNSFLFLPIFIVFLQEDRERNQFYLSCITLSLLAVAILTNPNSKMCFSIIFMENQDCTVTQTLTVTPIEPKSLIAIALEHEMMTTNIMLDVWYYILKTFFYFCIYFLIFLLYFLTPSTGVYTCLWPFKQLYAMSMGNKHNFLQILRLLKIDTTLSKHVCLLEDITLPKYIGLLISRN